MTSQKNFNFETNVPLDRFNILKDSNKIIKLSLNKIKGDINKKKNVFYSFSKNFKINFDHRDLKKFRKFKRVIIIGMGGSILGAQAINYFLKKKENKDYVFINNLDLDQISEINRLKNLKNSLFMLISKSGNTVEVLSIINSLKRKAKFNSKNSIVITDNKKNCLNTFAQKLKIKTIFHRSNIGGRYSIFSETALVPCLIMGTNISKFKMDILSYLNKKKSLLIKNLNGLSRIYNSNKINSLIFLNYCHGLDYFLLWCQQLIAESLGKKGKGIIPVVSIGPRDHHSLLQLYLDGPRDKFFYIFSLKEKKKLKKNGNLFVDVLNNASMSQILENQKNAMTSLLKIKKIPFISIEIKKRNEEALGELFSYFILETVVIADILKVNPFNQPAVEELKIIAKKKLFKKNQK